MGKLIARTQESAQRVDNWLSVRPQPGLSVISHVFRSDCQRPAQQKSFTTLNVAGTI